LPFHCKFIQESACGNYQNRTSFDRVIEKMKSVIKCQGQVSLLAQMTAVLNIMEKMIANDDNVIV